MKNKKISLLMILIFIVSMTVTAMAQEEITKDGLTASEVLIKSNDTFNNQYTTLKFKGTTNMNTKTTGSMMIKKTDPNNEGQFVEEEEKVDENVDMTMSQEGIFEKPEKVYVKTTTSVKNMPEEQKTQSSEVLMDQGVMYMRIGENTKWLKLDINPMMQEMKKIMGNDGTNMGMTKEQMELFGMYASYDENTVIDGKEYYVINVNMDSTALKEITSKAMDKIFDQFEKIMEETEKTEAKTESTQTKSEQPEMDKETLKKQMQEMFSKMNMNVTYKYYINKETKMYEFMDISQIIDMNTDKIHIQTTSTGKYKYYDFNKEVTFPIINAENLQEQNH
ncbi:MAG: hypothetical protein N4A57_14600 [Anaeromicrobium sp.]|jgi:hypothetical protein|uniref:hypothetical protein n=1 Tax=Anaeromicrobium sp. TaxID=1929132 RepID=UPI0025CE0F4D|nr:hypothetical protein [Anaeromicrobium sp.]MCT4595476.1 hypothetical protein [Anaeromicrobium sp.]